MKPTRSTLLAERVAILICVLVITGYGLRAFYWWAFAHGVASVHVPAPAKCLATSAEIRRAAYKFVSQKCL